eukprot:CAMPEP_0167786418 /NCGR_PEP_ID=MMETSP0111_2-20121227/8787_1 /TAXON_ID=91324 /ORGANISM="Lotharella globosa, Strain CCCM811" /LENGTH=114 /DNA_ID=CAMNT_0007677809 /DNA_START=538 /DNA_END=882 /DNA_ORIENTATION=+
MVCPVTISPFSLATRMGCFHFGSMTVNLKPLSFRTGPTPTDISDSSRIWPTSRGCMNDSASEASPSPSNVALLVLETDTFRSRLSSRGKASWDDVLAAAASRGQGWLRIVARCT